MTTDPQRIRNLATFAEQNGAHSKAEMLRQYADTIELYEPVVEAVSEAEEEGEYDRAAVEQAIQEAEV